MYILSPDNYSSKHHCIETSNPFAPCYRHIFCPLVVQINAQKSTKPAILIDAACHAREWISPASVMFFTEVCMSVVNIFVDIL